LGVDSSAVDIRASGGPSAPAKPETSVNTNISVTITWIAPYYNGSPITGYTVAIRQNDGVTYTTESVNCNSLSTKCTVPIAVLLAAPYYLPWGASIYAIVLASNVVTSSAASTPGYGAIITTNPDAPLDL
jgi:hypothetical protein